MVAGVELPVDSERPGRPGNEPSIHVRMLGSLTIRRDGLTLALPASRKVRALFAYLALAPLALSRSQLCELLWDVPNDPRGELRWCLSKIRSIVDEPGRRRAIPERTPSALDLAECFVDAIEIDARPSRAIERSCAGAAAKRCPSVQRASGGPGNRPQPGLQWMLTAQLPGRFRGVTPPSWNISPGVFPMTKRLDTLSVPQLAPFDQRIHRSF